MRRHLSLSGLAVGLALITTGCPADEQAIDPPGGPPVDMRPDPRIQQAPAYPTPPGQVPIGLEPDTTRGEPVDLDTISAGQAGPGGPGALPAQPGAPGGVSQQPAQPDAPMPPPRP
jgi:hypothetical protein